MTQRTEPKLTRPLEDVDFVCVHTIKYEACHHRKPSQPRGYKVSPWAFQIDMNPTPVFITASYKDALRQAKRLARYSVTVLP